MYCVLFCLKLEVLKRLFLLSDIPQPLDITLKAFQTKYVKAAEYIIGNRIVIKLTNLVSYMINIYLTNL